MPLATIKKSIALLQFDSKEAQVWMKDELKWSTLYCMLSTASCMIYAWKILVLPEYLFHDTSQKYLYFNTQYQGRTDRIVQSRCLRTIRLRIQLSISEMNWEDRVVYTRYRLFEESHVLLSKFECKVRYIRDNEIGILESFLDLEA